MAHNVFSGERLLIVEDDRDLVFGLGEAFRLEGLEVVSAPDVSGARKLLFGGAAPPFDVVILDLSLPDGSGLDILREIRRPGIEIPVVILSARSTELDRVLGLEIGADDYVCKPFSLKELTARVRAVLRRSSRRAKQPPASFSYRGLCVRFDAREVTVDGKGVRLSFTEFQLLSALIRNSGIVLEREALLNKVWDGVFIDQRSVDPHISRLRKKIAPYGDMIETVPNVGYVFKAREDTSGM